MATEVVAHEPGVPNPRSTERAALRARAPAKLNLSLSVQGCRPDGYHELTSLVVGVELFDELNFRRTDDARVNLTCDDGSLPIDTDNHVVRAAELLAKRLGARRGALIELSKRIPIAAGLGGGSSDAAVTLMALNLLWGAGLSSGELAALGAELGSDVPLFFALPSAIISGRGEIVAPVRLAWSGWMVLAFGQWPVSTPATYANWRLEDHRPESEMDIGALLTARRAADLAPLLFNELEPAVCRTVPPVADYHARLDSATGLRWRLSGAGATGFTLFDGEEEARAAASVVEREKLATGVAVVRAVNGSIEDHLWREDQWRFPKLG